MFRKLLLSFAVLGSLLLLWQGEYFVFVELNGEVRVNVLNKAKEPISVGRVSVRGHDYDFGPVAVNSKQNVSFTPHADSGVIVSVEFASGKKLVSAEAGYITSGMRFNYLVEVRDDAITISIPEASKKP